MGFKTSIDSMFKKKQRVHCGKRKQVHENAWPVKSNETGHIVVDVLDCLVLVVLVVLLVLLVVVVPASSCK